MFDAKGAAFGGHLASAGVRSELWAAFVIGMMLLTVVTQYWS